MNAVQSGQSNGRAAAASLAAGLGCLVMGVLTSLSEASQGVGHLLNFYNPAGSLTGKSTITVIVWLLIWSRLHKRWKDRDMEYPKILTYTVILFLLGVLGTFPPFFELLK